MGRSGEVAAIEPICELAQYLSLACSQLRLPVRVTECCLSACDGSAQLFIPTCEDGTMATGLASIADVGQTPAGISRVVTTKTLDNLLTPRSKRVSFIKCDVEGHELEVFRGGTRVLAEDRPNLLVEIEQRHLRHDIRESFGFFAALGYHGWFVEDGNLRDIRDFRVERHQSPGSRPYVNNFLFLPAEKNCDPRGRALGSEQ